MLIERDNYLSVEEFRRLWGFSCQRTVMRHIQDGTIKETDVRAIQGLKRITYLIRRDAIVETRKRGRKRKNA